MKFSLTSTDRGIAIITLLEERATHASLPSLRMVLAQLHEAKRHHVVLNLEHAEYVDSSTLGVFIVALRRAITAGGDVKMVALQPPVRAIVELTRLHRVFDVHTNVREAVAAFGAVQTDEWHALDKVAS